MLPSGNPRVSIIVPARNEEDTIEQALRTRKAVASRPGGSVKPTGHGLAKVAYWVRPLSRLQGTEESVKPKAGPISPLMVCREAV